LRFRIMQQPSSSAGLGLSSFFVGNVTLNANKEILKRMISVGVSMRSGHTCHKETLYVYSGI
jgi:hypothetical protein